MNQPEGAAPDELRAFVTVGTPVVSATGEVLGTVGEVGADRFKVRAALAPDYWLDFADILGVAEGGDIAMRFEIGDLDQYLRPGPA